MFEYILIEFSESREVVIDGNESGYNTNEVVELESGIHSISLVGEQNYSPGEIEIDPVDTSSLAPEKLKFTMA